MINEVRADIRNRFAFLADIHKPAWPNQGFASDLFEKVMDAIHHDGWLLLAAFFYMAKEFRIPREFALQDRSNFETLSHNVVEQHLVFGGFGERFAQQFKI